MGGPMLPVEADGGLKSAIYVALSLKKSLNF